jgi:hypothetical protein
MTGTTEIDSAPLRVDQIFGLAIQATWTGTPNGTIKLQASCDTPPTASQVANGGPDAVTNWSDISDSSYSISGVAGNYMWNINGAFYNYIRIVYVNASSTGSLSAKACVKG